MEDEVSMGSSCKNQTCDVPGYGLDMLYVKKPEVVHLYAMVPA